MLRHMTIEGELKKKQDAIKRDIKAVRANERAKGIVPSKNKTNVGTIYFTKGPITITF